MRSGRAGIADAVRAGGPLSFGPAAILEHYIDIVKAKPPLPAQTAADPLEIPPHFPDGYTLRVDSGLTWLPPGWLPA